MSFFKKLFGKKSTSESPTNEKSQPLKDQLPWMTEVRGQSFTICEDAGFKPSKSLPTEWNRQLRPAIEIAGRLHSIKTMVLWLMVPAEMLPDERILDFVEQNGLKAYLTAQEATILSAPRDDQELRNSIGWKFENAWSLAWYFGYAEPDITGQMMSGEQMQDILKNYTSGLNESVVEWVSKQQTASLQALIQQEDLFYCLHNAVRSAQLGGDTVPAGFHPVSNGGVIHERRHALTWMLSRGVSWEETDLST